jgi:hypothetical protein
MSFKKISSWSSNISYGPVSAMDEKLAAVTAANSRRSSTEESAHLNERAELAMSDPFVPELVMYFDNEQSYSYLGWKPFKDFKFDARVVSDAIIGLSDGLTVPFALTAGLSALGDTKVVIYGGLAELTAGAISMGLGGYLGAKSEE